MNETGRQEPPTRQTPRWGKVGVNAREHQFLRGPRSALADGLEVARIGLDYVRGFRALEGIGPCVTVFGSARFHENHPYYHLARRTGAALAQAGFTVLTGGGPGIMEAANRGAWDVDGTSVGVNIELPHEQKPNDYLDIWMNLAYFHVRKVMLIKYSYAFIVMPGGYGTLDEIFDTTTLIQTGKIRDFPVIVMGVDFWQPLLDFMRDTLLVAGTIDQEDLDRLVVTDSPEEATACVLQSAVERFGLQWEATAPRKRRRRRLREAAPAPAASREG